MRLLFALFVVVPILEMLLLIKVGGVIGALPTVALVCLTAAVGVALIRAQGVAALNSAQKRMQQGQLPAQEMVDGLCLVVGGAMLLTPGFVTDTVGFLLLVPGLRKQLMRLILSKVVLQSAFVSPGGFQQGPAQNDDSSRTTLEGEFRKED